MRLSGPPGAGGSATLCPPNKGVPTDLAETGPSSETAASAAGSAGMASPFVLYSASRSVLFPLFDGNGSADGDSKG